MLPPPRHYGTAIKKAFFAASLSLRHNLKYVCQQHTYFTGYFPIPYVNGCCQNLILYFFCDIESMPQSFQGQGGESCKSRGVNSTLSSPWCNYFPLTIPHVMFFFVKQHTVTQYNESVYCTGAKQFKNLNLIMSSSLSGKLGERCLRADKLLNSAAVHTDALTHKTIMQQER